MILHIFYLSALGVIQIALGTSEEKKFRSLGRVNYDENSFRCTAEGFHPDTRDCRTFYRCVDWTSNDYFRDYIEPHLTAFRFECGEGTVFDPDFNICNHPRDTSRAECGGRRESGSRNGSGSYSPTDNNIQNPSYYPSQSGYPEKGNQGQAGYPGQEGLSNENENQITPINQEGSNREPLGSSENCQSSGFYAVKGNCQKFIRCVDNGNGGYTKYEFSCGPGTVWDPVNTVCNYPSQVPGCGGANEFEKPGLGGMGGQVGYPDQGGYPGSGGAPGQGGYPGSGGAPGQGGYPGSGGSQGQGGYPGSGGAPGQGGYPGSGGAPGQGGYPGSGGSQGQGGYPGSGGSQGQGGYPGSGGAPGQGGYPGSGGAPGQGGYPGSGGSQGQGGYPGSGGAPGQGGYPGSGGAPGQGGYPGSGGAPGQGGYPGSGGAPGQGGYPGSGGSQGQGGYPGSGGSQGQGGYPSSGGSQGQGGYPSSGGSQGQGGYPGSGGAPGQGGYPGSGGAPGQGGYPGSGGSQGQGGYPSSGGSQGQGEYPNQEGSPAQQGTNMPEGNQGQGNPPGEMFTGKCSSPGFFAVPGNCKKFIRCVENENGGFNKYEFDCAPGTAWDTQLNTCNHASMVEGCNNPGQIPTGEVEQGTVGSPDQGEKPGQGFPAPEEYPSSGAPGQGGYPDNGSLGRPRPDISNNSESQNLSPGDVSECQNNGFYPVKNNCKAFFRCVQNGKEGYIRYDFQCGEGTVWDQENQVCNYPWSVARNDVNCDMSSTNQTWTQTTSSSSSTFSQSTSSFINSSTATSQNQFSSSSTNIQTGSSQSQTQMGTSSNSQTLSQGSQTSSVQTSNQQANQFSSSRPMGQGSTKPMIPQPQPTTEKPKPEITSPDRDPSKPPSGSSPCDQNKIPTVIKCERAGFYPVPGDCSKFYRCVDWEDKKFSVYYFECGKGTIWDPALETCNHEESVYPPRDCSSPSTENNQKPITEQSTVSAATGEPNNGFTTEGLSTNEPIATKQSTTVPPGTSIIPDKVTSSSISESQMTTTVPTVVTQTSTATVPTFSTDRTESTTTPVDVSMEVTESTSFAPTSSTSNTDSTEASESTTSMFTSPSYSTDLTESTTKTEGPRETTTESTTTSPTQEITDSATGSQTESTTPSSTSEPTEFTESTTSTGITTEASGGKNPNCPQLNDDQSAFVCPTGFRRHPKDCNLFYQCTTSKNTGDINIMVLSCKNDTVYDERKIQCLPPDETDTCQNQGQGRRVYRRADDEYSSVVYVSPYKRLCPEEGSFAYEGDCSRFYKCKKDKRGKIQGYLYQCPENYSFNDVTGRCEKSSALLHCSRSMPEVTVKSIKWMKSKVPVDYFNLSLR